MIRKRTPLEREVDRELISKGKDVVKDFDESQAFHVPAKQWDTQLISIRLPKWMILRLRENAMRKGSIGYQQLIKLYLAEALSKGEAGSPECSNQPAHPFSMLRDVSLASSSLSGRFGFPDYTEAGEANQFRAQQK